MWAIALRVRTRDIQHGIKIVYTMDGAIRKRSDVVSMAYMTSTVKDVSYADDAAIPAAGFHNTATFDDFYRSSVDFGLQVSLTNVGPNAGGKKGKTVAMRITYEDVSWEARTGEGNVKVGPGTIPLEQEFIHLGMVRNTNNDLGIKADIERRIRKGTSVMGTLEGLWRDKTLTRRDKARMMLQYALPTGLYGDSNWALTRPNIRRLQKWWNKMTRWTYGVHTPLFQELGKTHAQLRSEMGMQEIMTYVTKRVLTQIGHLVRKPPDDPAKQLMFGYVADRKAPGRHRTGGRRGRSVKPPRRIQQYYADTLAEVTYEGYDHRIWFLLAQDRGYWMRVSALGTPTPTAGGGPQGPSLTTVTLRLHAQTLAEGGLTTTTTGTTGRTLTRSTCPLRCGWVGCYVKKHIMVAHPLHPVTYRCTGCEREGAHHVPMVRHARTSHVGASIVPVLGPSCKYKWDYKLGFLRTYPPGTPTPITSASQPYPEGWLRSTPHSTHHEDSGAIGGLHGSTIDRGEATARGVCVWNGEGGTEALQRSERRAAILQQAGARTVEDLSQHQRRQFFRTMAYARSDDGNDGWGAGRLPRRRRVNRRRRTHRDVACQRRCGWGDHVRSTKTTCPLHPEYTGPKPVGRHAQHPDSLRWVQSEAMKAAEAQRLQLEIQRNNLTYVCERGCGRSFANHELRRQHMQRCMSGPTRRIMRCPTPGCTTSTPSVAFYNKHVATCTPNFEYQSPVCHACGYSANNLTWNGTTLRWEVRGHGAKANWKKHETAYERTRQVDCMQCGEPHLVPWCMISPKTLGRHFRCADNHFDPNMGSGRCRLSHPSVRPVWVESTDSGSDNDTEPSPDTSYIGPYGEPDAGDSDGDYAADSSDERAHPPSVGSTTVTDDGSAANNDEDGGDTDDTVSSGSGDDGMQEDDMHRGPQRQQRGGEDQINMLRGAGPVTAAAFISL